MERDQSPDLCDARALIASSNGGCSAGDRVANIDPQGNVYPCQFARSPEFLIGNVRDRKFSDLWADSAHPVLARSREKPVRLTGHCGSLPAPRTLRRGMPGTGICRIGGFLRGRSVLLCKKEPDEVFSGPTTGMRGAISFLQKKAGTIAQKTAFGPGFVSFFPDSLPARDRTRQGTGSFPMTGTGIIRPSTFPEASFF